MAGFILGGWEKSKVILLFVMAVVTLGWIYTRTFLLSFVLANSFLGFSMTDNLRHAVAATLLIIWRRIARTPFASIVTVLVTYPNNVLPMSNAVHVRRRVPKPLILNCPGLGAYLQIAHQTLNLLLSLLRIILAMIMKLLPLIMLFRPSWMSNIKKMVMFLLEFRIDAADDHDDSGDDDNDDAGVDDDDDTVAADNDNDMDDGDSCDQFVTCLHADYDESEEDPILGPRKGPPEDDDSPDFFINLRALKILDHCSPCKSLRYLLYHLLKRLLNLLPSDFVLLMFEV